jgi:peptidyl-prolyl cis-trans isomerase C
MSLAAILREPLVYFLLAGAALFAIGVATGVEDEQRIVVTDTERTRMIDQWQAQMGRLPTDEELEALIEQWIREEIYYREAIATGLDRDDVIVRRRLAQKLAFLSEDLAAAQTPEEQALREWYQAHAERYAEPERLTFSHRYFSTERRADARADALAVLAAAAPARTNADAAFAEAGDPFMLQRHYADRSQREIAELFGREFAAALLDLAEGAWEGPVRSAYGWHLVILEKRSPPRQVTFEEAAPRVLADYKLHARTQASDAFYQSLRARYEVVRL